MSSYRYHSKCRSIGMKVWLILWKHFLLGFFIMFKKSQSGFLLSYHHFPWTYANWPLIYQYWNLGWMNTQGLYILSISGLILTFYFGLNPFPFPYMFHLLDQNTHLCFDQVSETCMEVMERRCANLLSVTWLGHSRTISIHVSLTWSKHKCVLCG